MVPAIRQVRLRRQAGAESVEAVELLTTEIVQGLQEGWLRPDDIVRTGTGTWLPLTTELAGIFEVRVFVDPAGAYAQRYSKLTAPFGVISLALAGLTVTVATNLNLAPWPAVIFSIGWLLWLASVATFVPMLLRSPRTALIGLGFTAFVGLPIIGALTGVPPPAVLRVFTNLPSIIVVLVATAFGGAVGFGLGHAIAWAAGHLFNRRHVLPPNRPAPTWVTRRKPGVPFLSNEHVTPRTDVLVEDPNGRLDRITAPAVEVQRAATLAVRVTFGVRQSSLQTHTTQASTRLVRLYRCADSGEPCSHLWQCSSDDAAVSQTTLSVEDRTMMLIGYWHRGPQVDSAEETHTAAKCDDVAWYLDETSGENDVGELRVVFETEEGVTTVNLSVTASGVTVALAH
jgi:hypothetical protein